MDVVVVESPAKAKTINKYLGPGYTVLASYGHIRDLPAKDGSVRPAEAFAMDWETDPKAERQIREIAKALKGADRLWLATDPDREGEAISWHVREELNARKALNGVDVRRVVFNEITKRAVLDAMAHPRDLDRDLINAYLARRALDYLVGFTLSPVLWRKLPGSRSAGRVQSVALRLICEREAEIEVFRPQEYWSIDVDLATPAGAPFTARLVSLEGRKLDRLGIANKEAADRAVRLLESGQFRVAELDRKSVRRHPQPPFTTSTLQQEASRKLGYGASRTMQLAQRLYEGVDIGGETVGLITYMRTDGVQVSQEAVAACRSMIGGSFGERYVPEQPRAYRTRAKNAQEAHEAIRPTDVTRRPEEVRGYVDSDMARLYELVWKRMVASQMESAVLDQTTVEVAETGGRAGLRATGSIVVFDGFLTLYREDVDDADAEGEEGRRLPPMATGDALARRAVRPEQHFTQPPPRYSEASLVKKLEELGIGRPSTYASILQVLQDRSYVTLDKRRFVPEDRGRLVTAFLANFFQRYVQYNFTAELEEQLDEVSGGRVDWRQVLEDFWSAFSGAVEATRDLTIKQVLEALDRDLGPHFFPARNGTDGEAARRCPSCGEGRLGLRLGRHGAFIGCSNYPECRYTRRLAVEQTGDAAAGDGGEEDLAARPRILGIDAATGQEVSLRKGPYGIYVQLGAGDKPKRASLPKGTAPADVDLERALALLALPREVGRHPESGETIVAGIGRFGPYIKHGPVYVNLRDDDVLSIGLNRAVTLLAERKTSGRGPARSLGEHPDDGKPVTLHPGRFGPYVQHGGVRATVPRGTEAETLTLEAALPLLAAKAAKGGGKRPAGRARKAAGEGAAEAAKPKAAKAKPAKAAGKPAARKAKRSAGG